MNEIIKIEHKDQRVLTTQQLAESYETTSKVISNNHLRNKEHFKENTHYFKLIGKDLKNYKTSLRGTAQLESIKENTNTLYLWTERGCMLHAKLLETDKAWEVYEILVDTYFRAKEIIPAIQSYLENYTNKMMAELNVFKQEMIQKLNGIESQQTIIDILVSQTLNSVKAVGDISVENQKGITRTLQEIYKRR